MGRPRGRPEASLTGHHAAHEGLLREYRKCERRATDKRPPAMPVRILESLFVVTMVLTACTSISAQGRDGREGPPSDGEGDPSAEGAEAASGERVGEGPELKRLGKGLYKIGKPPQEGMRFIDHMVVGGRWVAFEPRDQIFKGPGWERIQDALRRQPKVGVRIRILAGRGSPGFVKHLGGRPRSGPRRDCSDEGGIAIVQPSNDISSCVPYFWTDAVLDQYEDLMAEVARRFEGNDRVLDVVNSACTTNWAEPFIRSGNDRGSNVRLWEAGLNEQTDRHCLERSMEIHDRVFATTRTSIAAHQQWQLIVKPESDGDGVAPSWTKERRLLNRFRSTYGKKLIVQNNGLGAGEGCAGGSGSSELFCWMKRDPGPNGFQTEGDRKLKRDGTTILDVVGRSLRLGACFVEHNHFGRNRRRARNYDDRLGTNCGKSRRTSSTTSSSVAHQPAA
jgi:hypothetical protein